MIKILQRILLSVFLLFAFIDPLSAYTEKRILVLHSYHVGLSWTKKVLTGIENKLNDARKDGYKFKIDYEYMDTKRFVDDSYYKLLYKIYKFKSKNIKYDVIISVDDNALQFLLRHRNSIFGKVPVVFCGVNYFKDSMLKNHNLYTGVVEAFDVKSTLNIALKLHPGTKKFVFVGDSSTSGIKNRQTVTQYEKEYKKKGITFQYVTDGRIRKDARDLQELKAGSIIVAMLFNRDIEGKFYTYEESFSIYSKYATVPIYTFWDFYLGMGSVGGKIISGITQGEEAAKRALRIIQGEKVQYIPILRKSPNRYMFDYKSLTNFSINMDLLPSDSIVINKPHEVWETIRRYKFIILGVLGFIFLLIGVIIILTFNIMKRKRVEKELLETNVAYDRFVPHAFLDNLNKESILDVKLGNQVQKEMSVLFSDIRSFTSLSEKMTPEENFNFLNSYLKLVSPVIRANHGFIDKYIGDAVMALFPNCAEDALKSAIDMQRSLFDFNHSQKSKGELPISIGVGIHIGQLMLGTVGEDERMEGTVISDVVNLASRIEGLTKMFGAGIIISDKTLEEIKESKDKYLYRFLGQVGVKGKKMPVSLYEILDGSPNIVAEKKIKTKTIFEKGIRFFNAGDLEKALEKFNNVLKLYPDDLAAKRYIERCKKYKDNPLPDNWTGIEYLDEK